MDMKKNAPPARIAERRPTEELFDIKEAEHLLHSHGERFKGWYLFKSFLKKQKLPLNYPGSDKSFDFRVFDYSVRFIMPPSLEFKEGVIPYSDAERRFGIFRFPRGSDGRYKVPVPSDKVKKTIKDQMEELKKMDSAQVQDMLRGRKVLTFEAFRIPQHGFEHIYLDAGEIEQIAKETDRVFARQIREEYDAVISQRISEVKKRIEEDCNYLLILVQVLNLETRDVERVSQITDRIIHE